MASDRLREQAAEELARASVDRLHDAEDSVDAGQLALPIYLFFGESRPRVVPTPDRD